MGGFMIGAAVIGAAGAVYSSNKASKSADKATAAAGEQLDWERDKHAQAEGVLSLENAFSQGHYQMAVGHVEYGMGNLATAHLGTASESKSMDAKAVLADMDSFIDKFKEALGDNSEAMSTFERRYGPIMDNVADGIMNVSQERLSASGREQLSLDRNTIMKDMNQKLATSGITRSGINVEMSDRMNMDFAKQSRKIDVDSYSQAQGLQAQGAQTLNGMYGIGENIRGRREQINTVFGQGMLQGETANAQLATNTNVGNANRWTQNNQFNAAQKTSVSMQNAATQTNVSQVNAGIKNNQGAALSNVHHGIAQRQHGAYLGFHSGVATPNAAPLVAAHQSQANAANADAAGWGQFAGSMLAKSSLVKE